MTANYRDPTHITDENLIDMNKVDEVHKLLAKWLREKMYGKDVREALARLAEQVSSDIYDDRQVALALEKLAKELQAKWDRDTQKIIDEWKNTLGGLTVDSEVINARIDLHGIVYKTLKERLDDTQSKIENLDATESVFKLTHNQNCYPTLRVFYSTYGAAVVPSEEEPTGAGGSEVNYVHAEPIYHDLDSMTVKVPFKYKMVNPTIERISENQYLLVEDIRTLLVEIGSKGEANVETTMEYTSTLDYKNKVANSIVENPNKSYRTPYSGIGSIDLIDPDTLKGTLELDGGLYKNISYKDNVITTITINSGEYRSQMLFKYNVVEDIKRNFPSLFNGLVLEQQAILARKYVVAANSSAFARGSNSDGNHCQINNYGFGVWQGGETNANKTNEIKKIGSEITKVGNYIQEDGTVNSLVSAKPSDGKIPSSLMVDYASLEYTVAVPFAPIK